MSVILNPVSIIIPIKNRGYLLPDLIENLSKLNYPQFEIIIVDDCSTDNTKEILKKYPVRSIFLEESVGSAKARNIGIKNAKYEIIALTDSDCFASKNWLKELIPFLDEYDVVGGKVIFNDRIETKLNPFNVDHKRIIKKDSIINFLDTSNMVFKKEVWKSVGGFLNYRIEDLEFSWRSLKKGYKLIYVPKGLVLHCNYRNPIKNIKKYFKYGKAYSKISFIHGMHLSYKPEPIINMILVSKFLQLIIYLPISFIILYVSNLINFKMEFLFFLSFFLLFPFIPHIFHIILKIDIVYKLFKFSITFSIVIYLLIYFLKKKDNVKCLK